MEQSLGRRTLTDKKKRTREKEKSKTEWAGKEHGRNEEKKDEKLKK